LVGRALFTTYYNFVRFHKTLGMFARDGRLG
jgi:hypothetical protein